MIQITKQAEPTSLIQEREVIRKQGREIQSDDFENLSTETKTNLKEALLKEQGHLCCYCMTKISPDKMRVEHFQPRESQPTLALNYQNILAACTGGEIRFQKNDKKYYTCDKLKGKTVLEVLPNPTSKSSDYYQIIEYSKTGKIFIGKHFLKNKKANEEINKVLNLNATHLVKARSDALKDIILKLKSKHKGDWRKLPKNTKQKYLNRYAPNIYREHKKKFCGFIYFSLKKKFKL